MCWMSGLSTRCVPGSRAEVPLSVSLTMPCWRLRMSLMPSGFSAYWASVLHGLGSSSIPTRRASSISAPPPSQGTAHPETDSTSFTFLGFAHIWGKSRAGKNVVRQVTAKSRYARALAAIGEWCRTNRHQPIPDQHAHLGEVMRGHYAYYGITGNFRRLSWYAYQVARTWCKWLSRRDR